MSSLHQRGEEGAEWVGWVSSVFLIFKVVMGKVMGKMVGKMVGKVLDKMEAPSKVRGSGLLGGWTGKCPAPASLITGVTKHQMSKSA